MNAQQVCSAVELRPGYARCFAWIRTDVVPNRMQPDAGSYGPSDLQTAYNLPSSTNGTGQTVGIVDAFGYPNAESDLGAYRSHYGLSACTTANGCFKKVNQTGGTSYPPHEQRLGSGAGRSTSTWFRRSARTATSCSWKRPTTASRTSRSRRSRPSRKAPARSATRTAAASSQRRTPDYQAQGRLDRRQLRRLRLRRATALFVGDASSASAERPSRRSPREPKPAGSARAAAAAL